MNPLQRFDRADAFAQAFDAQLNATGLALEGGGFVKRVYRGAIAGLPARAELSVLVETDRMPTGYYLQIELETRLAARWAAGRNLPVFHRTGMHTVPDAPLGLALYAHDLTWARRLVEHPPTRDALSRVLGEASFVKHFPDGRLQMQSTCARPQWPAADWEPARLVRAGRRDRDGPPAPAPAKPRWSDHTALVMAIVTVAVLGAFVAMGWWNYVLVR
jgi:hypothetical protein